MRVSPLSIVVVFLAAVACSSGARTDSNVAPQAFSPQVANGAILLTIPPPTQSASRAPAYVSGALQSVAISINGAANASVTNVSAGSPSCVSVSGGGRQCTIYLVNVPLGNDTFTMTMFDGANGTGNQLGSGSTTSTIVSGQTFAVTITLNGIVASVGVTVSPTSLPRGASATATISVTAKDASGNTIIGPGNYSAPVVLTNSDTSGATTIAPAQLSAPGQTATLTFSGSAAVSTIALGATVAGVASSAITGTTLAIVAAATPAPSPSAAPTSPQTTSPSPSPLPSPSAAGTASGSVTTLAGPQTGAGLSLPYGLVVSPSGTIYISDTTNQTIRVLSPSGVISTLAGTTGVLGSADGTGTAARFNFPNGITLDASGNIFVADLNNNEIRRVTPGGVVTTFAGSMGNGQANGTGTMAQFGGPSGIAIDPSGNFYVADLFNYTVRKITPAALVTTFAGTPFSVGSADGTGPSAQFNSPFGVAVDAAANVYVSDINNSEIRKITPAGVVTTLAGSPGQVGSADGTGSAARFNVPRGLAVDARGNVYVADQANHEIRKITPAGVVTTLAGSTSSGFADGIGSAARFLQPSAVAVDSNGNIYVADTGNNAIRKIAP